MGLAPFFVVNISTTNNLHATTRDPLPRPAPLRPCGSNTGGSSPAVLVARARNIVAAHSLQPTPPRPPPPPPHPTLPRHSGLLVRQGCLGSHDLGIYGGLTLPCRGQQKRPPVNTPRPLDVKHTGLMPQGVLTGFRFVCPATRTKAFSYQASLNPHTHTHKVL